MAHRRWRGATYRAGQRWDPPWPFVAPPPPERPPQWQYQAGRPQPAPAVRRGQIWNPPWPFVAPTVEPWTPTRVGSRSGWLIPLSRGSRWTPQPFVPPPAPSPWTVQGVGTRSAWLIPPSRGNRWTPQPFEPPPAPAPWTVQKVGTRSAWTAPPPRGTRWNPPWPFVAPAPPAFVPHSVGAHRPILVRSRRGRFFAVPTTVGTPPRFLCARRRPPTVPLRRGRIAQPPPVILAVDPGYWLPGLIAARRRPPLVRARRGRFFEPFHPFTATIPARSTVTQYTSIPETLVASTLTIRNRSEVDTP